MRLQTWETLYQLINSLYCFSHFPRKFEPAIEFLSRYLPKSASLLNMLGSAVRNCRSSAFYRIVRKAESPFANRFRTPYLIRLNSFSICILPTSSFSHPAEQCRMLVKPVSRPRRFVFSGDPKDIRSKPTELSDNDYHEKADRTLDSLTSFFEDIGDNFRENPDYDVMYASGVLTVSLLPGFTFVMNKQSPNHQIWLSSPISGPKRFDFMNETWTYHHDGSTLHDLLSREISELLKRSVDFTDCDSGQSKSS